MIQQTVYPFNPCFNMDFSIPEASANYHITSTYQSIWDGLTGSGTSGTTTITANATVAVLMFVGQKFRIGATDVYTVLNISTTL
jgi:hypothetical protein